MTKKNISINCEKKIQNFNLNIIKTTSKILEMRSNKVQKEYPAIKLN